MDKLTYLAELAEGLARWVPERERQDILRYYAEYFEEAGPDREAQVVAELGDPWALSCRLAVEGGYVTWQQANSWTPPKKKKWPGLVAGVVLAAAALIAVPAAMMASAVGRFVGGNVASRFSSEPQAIVEAVDNGQFGIAEDLPGVDYEEADGSGGFWSMEDGYLEPFHEIDVDAGIANVTVTGGEDYTLFISSDSTLGGYRLKWEVDDGVPKTGLGDVFASGLEVVGKLEAETGLGDIECSVRAYGEVELETGMGDVTLGVDEPYGGAKYDLKTGMGSVEAQLNSYEKEWDYEAKTGMGTVTVNEDGRGTKAQHKGGSYELEAETGMGDVQLYFRDDRW